MTKSYSEFRNLTFKDVLTELFRIELFMIDISLPEDLTTVAAHRLWVLLLLQLINTPLPMA